MNFHIKCSGCAIKIPSDQCEAFDGTTEKGEIFSKRLCPKCVKEIVSKFRRHIKEREAKLEDTQSQLN